MRSMTFVSGCAALVLTLWGPAAGAQTITEVIDSEATSVAVEIAVEGAGNVYVASAGTDTALKITPDGTITEIIDSTGDGTHGLEDPWSIAVDASGNVYLVGRTSDNAFKITPDRRITEIIDSTGDGTHALDEPRSIAVDASGSVYVAGHHSNNAFKITPGGTITEIIDSTGDGTHGLGWPRGIAVDASGNVCVTGLGSDNAFKITPGGTITEIIDSTGDGTYGLDGPHGVAVDGSGNVFVTGIFSDNAFKISPDGTITEIIDSTGDGTHGFGYPYAIAAEGSGSVYVAGNHSHNAFKITPDGTITEIIDSTGDGTHGLHGPRALAVEGSGIVYVAGASTFKITPQAMALSGAAGLLLPGFEVAIDDPSGPTTFFAVRNTSDEPVFGFVDYFGVASSEPLRTDAFALEPHETLPQNVRDDLSELEIEDGRATGFLVVTEVGGTTAPHLEGDYLRVDFGNDFATGDRLVRPEDFCLQQEIRFVDFGSGSELRILVNRPRGDEVPSFSYTAYDEAGTMVANGEVFTSDYLSVLDVGELVVGENFGTVHFDFSSSGGGWVSAKYSAFGRFSVELNSACRDD